MMDEAEYTGPIDRPPTPEEENLLGQVAIVIPDETYDLPLEQRTLKAQFKGDITCSNERWHPRHPVTGEDLMFGWHTFPASHFKLLVRVLV